MTRAMKNGEDINLPENYTDQDLIATPHMDPDDTDVRRLDMQPKVEDDPDEHTPLSLELVNHNPTESSSKNLATAQNHGFSPSQNQGPFTPTHAQPAFSPSQGVFSSQNHSPFGQNQNQGVFTSPQNPNSFSSTQSPGFSQNQNVFASNNNHGDVSPLEPEGPPESYFPQMPTFTADTAPMVMDRSPHIPTPPSNQPFSTPPGPPQFSTPPGGNPQQFYAPPPQMQMPPVLPSQVLPSSQMPQSSPPMLQSPHGMQPPPQHSPMMQPPPVPRAPPPQMFNAGPPGPPPPQSMMDVQMGNAMPAMQPNMQTPMMGMSPAPMVAPVAPPRQQQHYGSPVYRQDDESISQAENHSRYAVSALAFNDVKTAVLELRKALDALGAT
jgi:hypothetical protein